MGLARHRARMLAPLLGSRGLKFFLSAAQSSSVAASGWRGRSRPEKATRSGRLRRSTFNWWRSTKFSASSAARDRNSPARAYQMSLQRSAINGEHQPIRVATIEVRYAFARRYQLWTRSELVPHFGQVLVLPTCRMVISVGAGRALGGTGYRQTGGIERSAFDTRVPPLYPLTRAREGRADLSAVGQQRDPLAPPAGRRSHFVLAESGSGRTLELGRSGRSIMRPPRRRHSPRATGHRQTGGMERSGV